MLLQFLFEGGWALWVITGCSVIALGITFERLQTLQRAERTTDELIFKVRKAVGAGDVQGAIAICDETDGPVAATLGVGLRKLVLLEKIGKHPEEIEKGIVDAMEEHGGQVVNFLERNLTTLATVASLAPILGMMGTVIGMIRAFHDAGTSGNMTPAVVAIGISEALFCTAGGLIVAAMSTVEYNYFTQRVNKLILVVQAASTEMVEHLLETRAVLPEGETEQAA
jgi:biopolymer transport protein ExbB